MDIKVPLSLQHIWEKTLFTSSIFSKNKMALLPGISLHERLQPHDFKAQSYSILRPLTSGEKEHTRALSNIFRHLGINVHHFETVQVWEILKRDHRFGLRYHRAAKAHTSLVPLRGVSRVSATIKGQGSLTFVTTYSLIFSIARPRAQRTRARS
ncbi:hypothetical protein AMTR_s00074p00150610 [Amborella trichopoda]|uniref:Uncharacterized protein n=1 Tax=Amborella trichopoda TaxID=13333 RepID=W1NQ85_AMBTC|nr:hypothetical protein AMTR_s00074p00150610 [Amborella trichopoda]